MLKPIFFQLENPNTSMGFTHGCSNMLLGKFLLSFGLILRCFGRKSQRGTDEVSKEMLSKIFQTHVFVLAITWSFLIQIE